MRSALRRAWLLVCDPCWLAIALERLIGLIVTGANSVEEPDADRAVMTHNEPVRRAKRAAAAVRVADGSGAVSGKLQAPHPPYLV